ncbi:MAG TPA: radical SAM/SPASM domain-containing protein [Burkholderiales bacterium]|jgi:radical SAM protein with 4Fe4S-binding SPASM domain
MNQRYVPINKGNYSMDTPEREARFHEKLGSDWPEGYAKYRSDWAENAKNQVVADYPTLVDLELSSVCNLRCPMCYTISPQFRDHVDAKIMDFDMFKRIIDEIGGKVPALRLSLRGESTVHPKFVDAVRYAKEHGVKEISTLTHGGRLTLEYFKQVQEAGIDWITISIDGLKETYEKIRKPLKFDDLLDKLRAIKEYKEANGLVKPVIKVQGIWPAIEDNPQGYYDTFEPITDLVAFNPLIDYLGNDTQIEYLEDFTCPQQYQRLVIGADGLVMKCSNDEENREVIGDARTQTVHEIWHGEKMQKVREMHLQPRGFMNSAVCRKCYLPRKTQDDVGEVGGRTFVVRNYTRRIQLIGK